MEPEHRKKKADVVCNAEKKKAPVLRGKPRGPSTKGGYLISDQKSRKKEATFHSQEKQEKRQKH